MRHSGFWWCIIRPSLVAKNQQFRRYIGKSYFVHMSPQCHLDLEFRKQFFSAWQYGSWCCITIPSLVTKRFAVQKISSGQTFTDNLNLHWDLDLECSNSIFPQDTTAYDAVLSNQVWLQMDQQFGRYSRNSHVFDHISPHCDLDIEDRTNFSARHSGSWCCITIPSLITNWSAVQKISSRQTFTEIFNLCYDLNLERSNLIFPQNTLAYDAILSNQVWLQIDQQFSGYNRNSHILII